MLVAAALISELFRKTVEQLQIGQRISLADLKHITVEPFSDQEQPGIRPSFVLQDLRWAVLGVLAP